MSGATAELVRLIDLSLGTQPSGIVNFNYLHTLMHAIVGRLGSIEQAYLASGAGDGLVLPVATAGVGGGDAARGGGVVDGATAAPGAREGTVERAAEGTTTTGGDASKEGGKEGVVEGEKSEPEKTEGVDGTGDSKVEPGLTSSTSPPGAPPAAGDLSESRVSSSGRASRAGPHTSSDFYHWQKSSFVSAANDLGALERKMQELEGRLNTMDTLPELLERKSSDMGATPIKDRWNFTNLSKRLSAAEDGLEQVHTYIL